MKSERHFETVRLARHFVESKEVDAEETVNYVALLMVEFLQGNGANRACAGATDSAGEIARSTAEAARIGSTPRTEVS